MRNVTVLGAGSWGTALAVHLARAGHDVRLWARDPVLAADVSARRVNTVYLPDITVPENVLITEKLDVAIDATQLVVSAIPTHGCRAVMRASAAHIPPGATIVSATKGLEPDTLRRMSEVIEEELGAEHAIVVLSGQLSRQKSRGSCRRRCSRPRATGGRPSWCRPNSARRISVCMDRRMWSASSWAAR